MDKLQRLKHFLRPSNQTFIHFSTLLGRFKHPVWILGSGRSGTTWLCDLMRAKRKYRFLFEPFHSAHNRAADFLPGHFYLRPGVPDHQVKQLADDVFDGSTFFPEPDRANKHKLFDGLLVKDITANLFSYAIHRAKPEIDLILIIRNPFAVALSKLNKPGWKWYNDPAGFLKQEALMKDYLFPQEELIRNISGSDDYILNQILIWAVIHYVPLKQFSNKQLQIVFYEDLVENTDRELWKLEKSLRSRPRANNTALPDGIKHRPSKTTRLSAGELQSRSLTDWKRRISKEQLIRGNLILEQFGLDFLYDENGSPDIAPSEVLNKMQK